MIHDIFIRPIFTSYIRNFSEGETLTVNIAFAVGFVITFTKQELSKTCLHYFCLRYNVCIILSEIQCLQYFGGEEEGRPNDKNIVIESN